MRARFAIAAAALLGTALVVVALVAARGGGERVATAYTDRYTVRLELDRGAVVGPQGAWVDVAAGDARPVATDQMSLASTMVAMGHALPPLPAAPDPAAGRYRFVGTIFSMPGQWEVDVRLRVDGRQETARFRFDV